MHFVDKTELDIRNWTSKSSKSVCKFTENTFHNTKTQRPTENDSSVEQISCLCIEARLVATNDSNSEELQVLLPPLHIVLANSQEVEYVFSNTMVK